MQHPEAQTRTLGKMGRQASRAAVRMCSTFWQLPPTVAGLQRPLRRMLGVLRMPPTLCVHARPLLSGGGAANVLVHAALLVVTSSRTVLQGALLKRWATAASAVPPKRHAVLPAMGPTTCRFHPVVLPCCLRLVVTHSSRAARAVRRLGRPCCGRPRAVHAVLRTCRQAVRAAVLVALPLLQASL